MIMKKQLLLLVVMLLPMVASAYNIAARNADGVTIYYNWNSDKTKLVVTYCGSYYNSYDEYYGNVVIPESVNYDGKNIPVTSIGYEAFRDCYSLTSVTIPNSVTSIGGSAFYNCSDLTSITIPNSVTSIGYGAFSGCSGLTSLLVDTDNTVYDSRNNCNAIIETGSNTLIFGCKNTTIPNSLTCIGNGAFMDCFGLTSITIPNSVTSIGKYAFDHCSGLTSITIPNSVTSIGEYAFDHCSGLTSITIPNSVKTIERYTFSGCSNLTSVIIGSGVTSIDSDAFGSTNLKKVIWLTNTPPSGYNNVSGAVNYVSNSNFTSLSSKIVYQFLSSYFDVDGIRYVPVSPSERTCDAIDCIYDSTANNTVIASTVTYKGISMNAKNIQPYLAYNNKFIKSLEVDIDGQLSDYAFQNCSNMSTAKLGEKVSAIGNYAFSGCSSLESIEIPDTVKTLGSYAFQDCSVLKSAKMGSGIETINEYTFAGCKSLLDVKIGNNVKKINQYAFTQCSELPSIIIPQSVTEIGNVVFRYCTQLKNVIIENSDSELKLGYNYNSGYKSLFSDCPLDSVYIGRNISYNISSSYGYSPFYRNTSLRAVKITDKETEISANEFYGCSNLQRVIIGDGVTTISDYAFSGCQSLKFFTFGTQVKTIGKEAFSDCTSVVEIASKAQTPPTCGTQALDDINKWNCKLFVPAGCIAAYQAADQWKDFFFTEEGEGSGETETKKCEKPTISYTNGKLTYYCETEGAMCQSTITDADIKSYSGNEVQLTATYNISVYATKAGYDNSDVATATLCWIDVEPKTEGINNGIAQVPAKAVLIQAAGGAINVQGCDDGERIDVYSINGSQVGTAISQNGAATVNTTLQQGSVAIIKVGKKSIKVVVK